MNCRLCNAELEPHFQDEEKKQTFKLQYGKRWEVVHTCPNDCPGLWTETNMKDYWAMRARLKKKRFNEEAPIGEPMER